MGERFWPARVPPAISSRSILANLAAGTCGFRGIDSGRSCPNIRGRTGSKSAGAGRGSASQDADLLVRVPIQPDGSAGAIEIAPARLSADDFAFGMSGSLYITTHPEHTLVRLDPSGARTTLAGPEQGMVGGPASAFGRARGDEKALYITTDGGFLIPHESGIQDAKLVRMEVGESGWPLLQGV